MGISPARRRSLGSEPLPGVVLEHVAPSMRESSSCLVARASVPLSLVCPGCACANSAVLPPAWSWTLCSPSTCCDWFVLVSRLGQEQPWSLRGVSTTSFVGKCAFLLVLSSLRAAKQRGTRAQGPARAPGLPPLAPFPWERNSPPPGAFLLCRPSTHVQFAGSLSSLWGDNR